LLLGQLHELCGPQPAHDDHADADEYERLAGCSAVRVASVADRHACECHAERDEQDEPAREPNPRLLRTSVLAALCVEDAILDQRRQPSIEVASAELVCDQQRLAGGVGRRVGQP
jgi:hypothetical protein